MEDPLQPPTVKSYLKPFVVLTLVVVAAHFWFNTVDWTGYQAGIDLARYRMMAAEAPGLQLAGEAPFCYRILPPWLAGVAGKGLGDEFLGFRIVSGLAILFAAMMIFQYLVRKDVRQPTALLMACLAIISQHALGGVVFNPFQTCDALAIGLIVLMLMCIERGWIIGFVVASIAGALTREPCMIMLPVALTYYGMQLRGRKTERTQNDEHPDRKSAWKNLLWWTIACVPALLTILAVRTFIYPINIEWGLPQMVVEYSFKWWHPIVWIRIVIFSVAPLSLIPFMFFRLTRTVLAENIHLLVLYVLIVVSSFLGGDVERLIAPSAIVYYLIVARVLDLKPSAMVTTSLVVAAMISSMHPVYARYTLFTTRGALEPEAVWMYYALTFLVVVIVSAVIVRTTRTTSQTTHQ